MSFVLHHIFVLTTPGAVAGDALVELGLVEAESRVHPGQGTSNRRFIFDNFTLELLWLRDENEAINGPGRKLRLAERVKSSASSPFGIIICNDNDDSQHLPFSGWPYLPEYFQQSGWTFHVADNSEIISEPLCIYAPFFKFNQSISSGQTNPFKTIHRVKLYIDTSDISEPLTNVATIPHFDIKPDKEHRLEIFFNAENQRFKRDFRPSLPLVFYW